MNRYNTSLSAIFNTDYVDGGELYTVEHIVLRKRDGSTLERSGILIIFDGYVWLFDDSLRDSVTEFIKDWRKELHHLGDLRDSWYERAECPRYPPPSKHPILHLTIGTTDCHPHVTIVETDEELREEAMKIESLIDSYYNSFYPF